MHFDVVTIFPGMFEGPLSLGVVSRALAEGIASVSLHDLRRFTHDVHKTVDDRPYGGGEGMVLKVGPIFEAAAGIGVTPLGERNLTAETVILLSAQGKRFNQAVAHDLAGMERVILICGRYEGVDERVADGLCDREVSIGDYVLTGGELGAAVIIDAVVRLLPGVLGNPDSARFESFGTGPGTGQDKAREIPVTTSFAGGLLDYPHYTRPAEFQGVGIPAVLTGGNHEAIRRWRRRMALAKTLRNRPDLLERCELSKTDCDMLEEIAAEAGREERQ